jgi:D-alanine-D-alanine ligase
MVAPVGSPIDEHVVGLMSMLADQAIEVAPEVTLLFVTNIRDGDVVDIGPDGISNVSQYYTRDQAEAIIRSFQELGVTVESYFSERDFIARVAERPSTPRAEIVYTTAEGGTGSGRRALIPAMCSLMRIPILNSGAHACALARHKLHANAVLRMFGVRAPDAWQFGDGHWVGGRRPADGVRVIVKPAFESMCIGIDGDSTRVVDGTFDDFVRTRSEAFAQPVVVQDFVTGDEVGVPLIRIDKTYALQALEVRRTDGERFGSRPQTFEEHMRRDLVHVPYETEPAAYTAMQHAATVAFDAIGMSGVGRMDFRIDADGRPWLFDTNESPPPLAGTAFATAMQALGFSLERMLAVWLGIGLSEAGLISGV